ncbi:MAG TPA: c-type cytochrome [Gammaproteobacteria bacterium]|nr:c-type cytochrome [Gammaproteobacteria bacterium]
MNKLVLIFSAALALASTHTLAASDIALGQAKSATCIGCHGVNGNSVVPIFPKLAGQSEAYLLKQLREFKTSDRIDATMAGMVAVLTDADMQNIAAYYAAQSTTPGAPKKDANIALGEKIYRGGKKDTSVTACIACHGPQGKGIPLAGFPVLSSQHAAYIVKQLKLFRQDSINAQTGATKPSRSNDYEGMMINFTKSLTNVEIDAVSEYIAGLR